MKKSPSPSFTQLLPRKSFRVMPWKNGRGQTAEIAISPAHATLDRADFSWRLSSAEVLEPGPFSAFPGYERILCLAEGAELTLVFGGGERRQRLAPGERCRFAGEEAVHCELPAGPVRDLGLIFRPELVAADCRHLPFRQQPRSFALTYGTVFLYVLSGALRVTAYPGGAEHTVEKGDALRVEELVGAERLLLCEPLAPHSALASVEVLERATGHSRQSGDGQSS